MFLVTTAVLVADVSTALQVIENADSDGDLQAAQIESVNPQDEEEE